ncbi:MAG: SDR family oxidoreductase [Solirubrobacteraceae bacterium]
MTGAATGIGKGIATRLAGAGAGVVVNHLDTPDAADAVVASISDACGSAISIQADVSQRDQFDRLFAAASDHYGHIDILVNNAAVATLVPVADATETQIDTVLNVNVKGTVFGCQLAAQHLADGGRIINISSSTTGLALPGYGIYDMTKGAIEQLTRILAGELGPRSTPSTRFPCRDKDRHPPGRQGPRVHRRPRAHVGVQPARPRRGDRRRDRVPRHRPAPWITAQNIGVNGGTV